MLFSALQLSPSRLVFAFSTFVSVYAIFHLYFAATLDPTSVFFDASQGYKPRYSKTRSDEAEAFIEAAAAAGRRGNSSSPFQDGPAAGKGYENSSNPSKKVCVGVPTVARQRASYLRLTVGSLLQGLTPQEREEIHFIVFIAHSDPMLHPAYSESWLSNVADEVLTYDPLDPSDLQHVKEMEEEGGAFREKGLYDYAYLLRRCQSLESVEYIAVFEDDIVAMEGWYWRARAALKSAEQLSVERYAKEFLYLRLFYTEEFLGWNSEEWKTYTAYSVLVVGLPVLALWGLRKWSLSARDVRVRRLSSIITPRLILLTVPLIACLILAFFALGRLTVLPPPPGVYEMSNYGCCSQALVFPRSKISPLIEWYDSRKVGFVDVLTEDFADQGDELRWVIRPSLVQHVGRWSSKADKNEELDGEEPLKGKAALSSQEKIWSFGFEKWAAEVKHW